MGGQLVTLKFGRDDETEADLSAWSSRPAPATTRRRHQPVEEDERGGKGAPPQWL